MTKKRKLSNQVSNKTKVLVYADSPVCATGFGTVTRNVCEALYKTGRYSVDVLGINYWGDPHQLPYNIWPVGINNDRDPYGRKKVAAMLGQMDYDILFLLQDSFILDFMPQVLPALKQQGKTFRSICYYPIDGMPKEQWIKNVTTADYTFTYSKFGVDKSKEAYPGCGNIGIVPHGANFTDFKKLPDDQIKQFKHAFFGANKDKFIVTNVNRNQHRKDIPRTISAFKEFRKKVPNSILYLHMAAKDQGWNLDEVVKAYGFNTKDDVLFPDKFGPNQGYPIEVVNMIYNASDLLVSTTLGEGWGLCLHPDTDIYTEDGVKCIKDITVQDKVLSSDGTYNAVEGIMSRNHSGDLYNITTWLSNIPIKSSPEHGFFVLESDKYIWKKACELKVGDSLLFPRDNNSNFSSSINVLDFIKSNLNIRQLSNVEIVGDSFRIQSNFVPETKYVPTEINITESLMYLFGLYLAEGSISTTKMDAITFSFNKNEAALVEFVISEMKKVFGLDGRINESVSRGDDYQGVSVVFYSSVVCNLFHKLFGSGARNKKIHTILLNQPKENLIKLLYGEFMGDGSYSKTTYELSFSTTSKHVAHALRHIMAMLGILSSVRTSRVEYKVTVSGISKEKLLNMFNIETPDLDRSKAIEKCELNTSYLILPIKDITVEKYVGKLVDIQVANTNNFVAENVIVHNSWVEAMVTKTPVLMPSNTVFPELITEDRGYLCKSGTTPELTTVLPHDNEVIRPLVDTTDMANKMVHIYNNYDEALAKAENAYKWVSSELDWQGNVGKMWVDIFDKATLDLLTAGTAQESDISGGVIQAESL